MGPAADVTARAPEGSPAARASRRAALWLSVRAFDRRYFVGCVAGLLLGTALAVPTAYALLRPSRNEPAAQPAPSDALKALLEAGVAALGRKDAEVALGIFQAAAQAFPGNATVHNDICAALNDLGRYEEATAACITALGLNPGSNLAANNLRWAQAQLARDGKPR